MSQNTELIAQTVTEEWNQFQRVNNEGGPANCQGNWPMFTIMRTSQFLTWTDELLASYNEDLQACTTSHRNLLTEKYARMMASTDPQYYAEKLEPYLPKLSEQRIQAQERIIAQQVEWAAKFHERYPHLGENMRVMRTSQDSRDVTSFETYLRGELSTYSDETLELYGQMIDDYAHRGVNITERTVLWTVKLSGFETLEDAENQLSDNR